MIETRRRLASPDAGLVGFAAFLGFSLQLLWFWPGYATSDTFAQFEQATSGRYDDVHPPLMAFAWRGLLAFGEGTAPLFALVALLFWSGLARCVRAVGADGWRGAGAVLAIGLWPAVFLLLGQVWKDVALAAVLLHGAASAFRFERERAWPQLVACIAMLAIATALRHNAWPAVLPFVWLLCVGRLRWLKFAALSLALLCVPAVVAKALHAENKHVWTTLPVFDLGAITAATGEPWLPETLAPTLTPDEAKQFHRPWSNVALIDSGKVRISFFYPYTDAIRTQLVDQWTDAIAAHPGAYLAHRWAVFRPLLFGADPQSPRELVYAHAQRIAPADSAVRAPPAWFERLAEATWHTPLFAWFAYAVIAMAIIGLRRAGRRDAVALLASSAAYALPLFAVAVASEYRYVYWSVVSALLGIAVSLCSRSENRVPELARERAAR